MKFNDKIAILKKHFRKRIEVADKFREKLSDEMSVLQKNRKGIADSIEKYADDEFVVKVMSAQKEYFDLNFDKTYQNIQFEMEDFEKQLPLIEKFLELVDKKVYNKETLETYIDLFSSQLLRDIKEQQELEKSDE